MAEYIEKAAFIAHICQEAEGLRTKMPMDLVIAGVVNEVKSFPAADVAPVQRWIPATERLPKYGDWVLGIGPKNGYYVCEYRGMSHFVYGGDSPWFSAKGRAITVTHWMPLPEPPKEERADG